MQAASDSTIKRAVFRAALTLMTVTIVLTAWLLYRQCGRMEFVLIRAGHFQIGSPGPTRRERGGVEPAPEPHAVTLNRDFLLSTTEVTQWQYQHVTGENPSRLPKDRGASGNDLIGWLRGAGWNHPVEHVTWEQAVEPHGPLKQNILGKIRKQLAADPWRWQREMEAEWAEDDNVWLPQSLITSCIDPDAELLEDKFFGFK